MCTYMKVKIHLNMFMQAKIYITQSHNVYKYASSTHFLLHKGNMLADFLGNRLEDGMF